MARSLKKGPYIHYKLEKKVLANVESGKNTVIKTWSRASMISPDFVGQSLWARGPVVGWCAASSRFSWSELVGPWAR